MTSMIRAILKIIETVKRPIDYKIREQGGHASAADNSAGAL
ncbi:hypothetical protein RKAS3_12250 [Rhodoluna sp. KAS3]|nr:hypothetical protein RKAS3_12250 [Rhodoluna sp. KAS3]